MMNSYRQNKNSGQGSRRVLVVTTLVVTLVLAVDLLSEGSIRAFVRAGGARVWNAGSQVASAIGGSGFFSSRRALIEENETLKQEIARLTARLSTHQALEDENARLRTLVRLAEDLPGVAARVVSSQRSSPYGTFMLDTGSASGVLLGDLVVAPGSGSHGFVVGRVSEVSEHFALATQIFAPNISTEAQVGETPLVAKGRGGGNARAEAPRGTAISEGDIVIAPSLRGMSIGVVGSVAEESASAYQTVYIGLPVSLATLTFTYVVPSHP